MTVIEMIRRAVQLDGGDVELVEVTTDGVVRIRFPWCPHRLFVTLQMGLDRHLYRIAACGDVG